MKRKKRKTKKYNKVFQNFKIKKIDSIEKCTPSSKHFASLTAHFGFVITHRVSCGTLLFLHKHEPPFHFLSTFLLTCAFLSCTSILAHWTSSEEFRNFHMFLYSEFLAFGQTSVLREYWGYKFVYRVGRCRGLVGFIGRIASRVSSGCLLLLHILPH